MRGFKKLFKAGIIFAAVFAAVLGEQAPACRAADKVQALFEEAVVQETGERNLSKAVQIYRQVILLADEKDPLRAKSYIQMGLCQEKLGNLEEARYAFQAVLTFEADPASETWQAAVAHLQAVEQKMNGESPPGRPDWKGYVSAEVFAGAGFGAKDGSTATDFGSSFSKGLGMSIGLSPGLELRADVINVKWSKDAEGPFDCEPSPEFPGCAELRGTLKEELQNTAVFIGGRYFPETRSKAKPFLELGVTANFLEASQSGDVTCYGCWPSLLQGTISTSMTETKLGVAPGAGLKFDVTPRLSLGGSIRYYYFLEGFQEAEEFKPDFFNASLMCGYKF